MRDEKGLYYYPYPGNKQTRMYVKEYRGTVWFRMWNGEIPELWDEHGWVPYEAILQATEMHRKKEGAGGFDPKKAYDIAAAKDLLGRENP